MTADGPAPVAKKPWTLKRIAIWSAAGLLGLVTLDAVLDPADRTPAPDDSRAIDTDSADELRQSMVPIGGQGQIFAVYIPRTTNASTVEAAAKARCAGLAFCQVYAWHDATELPGAWPMLDREVAALSFRYALNRNTGFEETSWYCGSVGAKPGCTKADLK